MMINENVNYECVGMEQAGALGYGLFRDIIEKWKKFKKEYYRRGQNRLEMSLFGNDTFYGVGESLERIVFGIRRFATFSEEFRLVKLGEIMGPEGTLKSNVDINRRFGININWAEYFRLRNEVANINNELGEYLDHEEGILLNDWLETTKKGCKKFRKIMTGRRSKNYVDNDPRQIQ
jgi:hypothetical protein